MVIIFENITKLTLGACSNDVMQGIVVVEKAAEFPSCPRVLLKEICSSHKLPSLFCCCSKKDVARLGQWKFVNKSIVALEHDDDGYQSWRKRL